MVGKEEENGKRETRTTRWIMQLNKYAVKVDFIT